VNSRGAAPDSLLRRAGFAAATIGFILSALVHVASFFGVAFAAHGPRGSVVLALHAGAMALALPLILTGIARAPAWPLNARWRAIMKGAPSWGERAYQLFFLYFLVHSGVLLFATRRLARDEAASLPEEVRMFSAGWMLIFVLCAVAWWPPSYPHLDGDRSRSAP
jgi:hypothetical protein